MSLQAGDLGSDGPGAVRVQVPSPLASHNQAESGFRPPARAGDPGCGAPDRATHASDLPPGTRVYTHVLADETEVDYAAVLT
jgi:hypothetical protein